MRTKIPLLIGIPLLALSALPITGKQGTDVSAYEVSVANRGTHASVMALQTVTELSRETREIDGHMVAPPPRNRAALRADQHPLNRRKFYRPFTASTLFSIPKANTVTVIPKKRENVLLAVVDQPEITKTHKEIANEILVNVLPEQCKNTLKNFYVKYEKQKSRGLAGKSVMILDGTVPDEEFRALFIHESGHNIDLGCFQGTPDAGKSAYTDGEDMMYRDDPSIGFYQISWITSNVQKSNARPEDFVSGYAGYDAFEDFAESFAYFVLHNEAFAERAETNAAMATKYAWFRDTVFRGNIPQAARGESVWNGKAPWDITKLAYVWFDKQNIAQSK